MDVLERLLQFEETMKKNNEMILKMLQQIVKNTSK